MDAIQKDINQVFNDYKFKRLIKHVEQIYSNNNSSANIDQIYYIDKFKNDIFPWIEISRKIQKEIQKSELLKDKIDNVQAKYQAAMKQSLQDERKMCEVQTTNKSLEQRLTTAQTEIELLKSVKNDHEQLQKKTGAMSKKIDEQKKQNDELKK